MGGGYFFYIGEIKNVALFQTRKFSKNVKKQWRSYNFERTSKFTYNNLNGKLIFYPFSLPSSRSFVILYTSGTYQNFWGWFWGYFRRAWGHCRFGGGRGRGLGAGLDKPQECVSMPSGKFYRATRWAYTWGPPYFSVVGQLDAVELFKHLHKGSKQ